MEYEEKERRSLRAGWKIVFLGERKSSCRDNAKVLIFTQAEKDVTIASTHQRFDLNIHSLKRKSFLFFCGLSSSTLP